MGSDWKGVAAWRILQTLDTTELRNAINALNKISGDAYVQLVTQLEAELERRSAVPDTGGGSLKRRRRRKSKSKIKRRKRKSKTKRRRKTKTRRRRRR